MKKGMPKLLHRKQNYRELGFISIHTGVQQETRRRCKQCDKWMYGVELGFCRYRFIEYDYSIEHNVAELPWMAVVLKYTNHICVNGKDSPKNTISTARYSNLLYNCMQDNKDRISTHKYRMISLE